MVLRIRTRLCAAVTLGMTAILPTAPSQAAAPPDQSKAEGQAYPSRPLRIVDGYTAGGATDLIPRMIGQKLTERFGNAVIVENRLGFNSNIGAEFVAKAPPDGYTLFHASVFALASSASLYPQSKLGYDVLNDFAYVTLTGAGTYVLAMTPSLPVKSVSELAALAKSQPGRIRYGSSGVGGAAHLAGELLSSRAGVEMLHVPYKGGAAMLAAVAGGEVQISFTSLAGGLPLVKAGRITALAVTSANRTKTFPDVPTISESGFPGYDLTGWYGLLAPAATSSAIVELLNGEIRKIVQSSDIQEKFANLGLDATGSTPERFKEIMRAQIQTLAKIIKGAGIKPE